MNAGSCLRLLLIRLGRIYRLPFDLKDIINLGLIEATERAGEVSLNFVALFLALFSALSFGQENLAKRVDAIYNISAVRRRPFP